MLRNERFRLFVALLWVLFLAIASAAPADDCPRVGDGLCHCGDTLSEGQTYVIDPTDSNHAQKVAVLSQCSETGLRLEAGAIFDGAGTSIVMHEIDGPGCGAGGDCVANVCQNGPIPGRWCSGSAPGDNDIGFEIEAADGAVVRHVKVYGFYDGAEVRDSIGASLQHFFAVGNGVDDTSVDCSANAQRCGYGIEIVDSADTVLSGVDVRFSGDEGIHVSNSTGLSVGSYVWANEAFSFLGCTILENSVKCSGRENIYLLNSSDDAEIKSMATNYSGCSGLEPLAGKKVSVLIRDSDRVNLASSSFDDARILFIRDSNDGVLDNVVVQHTDSCVMFENDSGLTPNGNRIQNSELHCASDEAHVRSVTDGTLAQSGLNAVCVSNVDCFNSGTSQTVSCRKEDPANLINLDANCP